MANETNETFEDVKTRLDEIVDAVNVDGISLDAALDLYEEAVKLGMQASTLLEEGIAAQSEDGEAGVSSDDEPSQSERDQEDGIGVDLAEGTDAGQEPVTATEGEAGNARQQ